MRVKGTAHESGEGSGQACLKRAGRLMALAFREQGEMPPVLPCPRLQTAVMRGRAVPPGQASPIRLGREIYSCCPQKTGVSFRTFQSTSQIGPCVWGRRWNFLNLG